MRKPPVHCRKCVFFHSQSERCGAYDLPADTARERIRLCGPDGQDFAPRTPAPPLLTQRQWVFLVVVMLAVAAANAWVSA